MHMEALKSVALTLQTLNADSKTENHSQVSKYTRVIVCFPDPGDASAPSLMVRKLAASHADISLVTDVVLSDYFSCRYQLSDRCRIV